jgi:hypothetical protein
MGVENQKLKKEMRELKAKFSNQKDSVEQTL